MKLKIRYLKTKHTENLVLFAFFLLLTFGRNLTGLYIFSFRLGEYIVGLLFLFTHVYLFKGKDRNLRYIHLSFLLLFYYKFLLVITSVEDFLLFRLSSTIWVIVTIAFAKIINLNKKKITLILFASLISLYLLNNVYYPEFIKDFFLLNSDKFDFTKPSDLFLIFATTTFFTYKLFEAKFFYISTAFFSFLYVPIFINESRGAFFGYLLLILLFFMDTICKHYEINIYKYLIYIFLLGVIFVGFGVNNLDEVSLSEEKISSNNFSIDLNKKIFPDSLFYVDNEIIGSPDESINWRLVIWQTAINDMVNNNQLLIGNHIHERIPIMNHPYFKTIKYDNYNLHNFIIQFFAYFGAIGLTILILLFYYLVYEYNKQNKYFDLLIYILPVIAVSSFDSSMETVRFPLIFYFALGSLNNIENKYSFSGSTKKIIIKLLEYLNLKSLSIIRSLISYRKPDAEKLAKRDELDEYDQYKEFFRDLISQDTNKTLMDFGCGTGRYLEIFQKFKVVYLVDVSKHNLNIASEKAQKLKISTRLFRRSLSFLPVKVDYFFSAGVFGYFYQFDSKALDKIYSLLRKDGKAVIQINIKHNFIDDVLAVEEKKVLELLEGYDFNIHKSKLVHEGTLQKYEILYVVEINK